MICVGCGIFFKGVFNAVGTFTGMALESILKPPDHADVV